MKKLKLSLKIKKKDIELIGEKLLDEVGNFIFVRSQEHIVKNEAIDTGFLLRSGKIIPKKLEREIVYDAPYSIYVEFGTRPHFPPIPALEGWVRRKLRVARGQEEEVAFLVARKISREGTPERPFLRPAMEEAKARYKAR